MRWTGQSKRIDEWGQLPGWLNSTAVLTLLVAAPLILGCRSGGSLPGQDSAKTGENVTDSRGELVAIAALPAPRHGEIPPPPGTHGWPEPVLQLHILLHGENQGGGWSALVQHNSYGSILFEDLSLSPGLVTPEQLAARSVQLKAQVQSIGLKNEELRAILMPHLPKQPSPAAEAFPEVDRAIDSRPAEDQMAKARGLKALPAPEGEGSWWPLHLVDNPPFGPFDHYADLCGDGSILLLDAPGPSPGHFVLYLRLPNGPVLLGGASIRKAGELTSKQITFSPSTTALDLQESRRSLGRVLALLAAEPSTLILPGEEPRIADSWERKDILLHPPIPDHPAPEENSSP